MGAEGGSLGFADESVHASSWCRTFLVHLLVRGGWTGDRAYRSGKGAFQRRHQVPGWDASWTSATKGPLPKTEAFVGLWEHLQVPQRISAAICEQICASGKGFVSFGNQHNWNVWWWSSGKPTVGAVETSFGSPKACFDRGRQQFEVRLCSRIIELSVSWPSSKSSSYRFRSSHWQIQVKRVPKHFILYSFNIFSELFKHCIIVVFISVWIQRTASKTGVSDWPGGRDGTDSWGNWRSGWRWLWARVSRCCRRMRQWRDMGGPLCKLILGYREFMDYFVWINYLGLFFLGV